ncbi:MAG TPA: ATP-binding cassette domain-containing protein [Thermoanaerobaculia bacterium]
MLFDRVTAGVRGIAACREISLAVGRGTSCVLVGRPGSGKQAIVRCLRGDLRPQEGRVRVFGLDPRRERRAVAMRIASGELVLQDERLERKPDATVFATASDPALASAADHVGFLAGGRLVLDGDVREIVRRFRRIRYVNEITEARTEYGNELDLFDAVRVRVRGWGVDAVVSNFDEAAFERFRATEGVTNAQALPMTLTEIFEAVVGAI